MPDKHTIIFEQEADEAPGFIKTNILLNYFLKKLHLEMLYLELIQYLIKNFQELGIIYIQI